LDLDGKSELLNVPGTNEYLNQKQEELNEIQTNMGLEKTGLPTSMMMRNNEMGKYVNELSRDNQSHLSPERIKQFWAEDERAINLLILSQQKEASEKQKLNQNVQNDDNKMPTLDEFNLMAKYIQIPQLFHPLHGLDQFLAAQQQLYETHPPEQPRATSSSFLSAFSLSTPEEPSQNTQNQSNLLCSKRDVQLYEYIQHELTQKILEFAETYPHLHLAPVKSPLGFVQGDLLPPINPLFSLTPTLVTDENPIPSFRNPKFESICKFIHQTLLASPTAIPNTLEFIHKIHRIRLESRQFDQTEEVAKHIFGPNIKNLPLFCQTANKPQPTSLSPFHYNSLTTPILDTPVIPHPRDFRAVLLWDSLDSDQRRIYSIPRREPRTGATAWQDAEFSRPGLERHPFNRAFVRGNDTNEDILSYRGGLRQGNNDPDEVQESERIEHFHKWCQIFPEQAFNRHVIDMIRDHAWVASHPAMQEYLKRRVDYNFGQVSKQRTGNSGSKWDSDGEDNALSF